MHAIVLMMVTDLLLLLLLLKIGVYTKKNNKLLYIHIIHIYYIYYNTNICRVVSIKNVKYSSVWYKLAKYHALRSNNNLRYDCCCSNGHCNSLLLVIDVNFMFIIIIIIIKLLEYFLKTCTDI